MSARTTLASFAEYLSERLDRPVVDQTGLTGRYPARVDAGYCLWRLVLTLSALPFSLRFRNSSACGWQLAK
jgi:Protein of unknown function (DUF3738)